MDFKSYIAKKTFRYEKIKYHNNYGGIHAGMPGSKYYVRSTNIGFGVAESYLLPAAKTVRQHLRYGRRKFQESSIAGRL